MEKVSPFSTCGYINVTPRMMEEIHDVINQFSISFNSNSDVGMIAVAGKAVQLLESMQLRFKERASDFNNNFGGNK